ncbi:arsenate reductase family protein [Robiginitalea sp. IMCC43444]|uniref:arsenate reductase family protein n=1 Tax=Robiginitalea sp. IMCC43444 TaxID=3459121 RepID=UPI004041C667
MKIMFYLSSCDSCRRIIKELSLPEEVNLQDIKKEPLNSSQLDTLRRLSGSYEALFSKRARLYTQRKLKDKKLSEADYRDLLLEHYSFLKRPVLVLDKDIYIGNSAKTVAAAQEALSR